MNPRIALFLAVVLGVVAALAARVWVQNERVALAEEKRTMPVIAAARRISPGQTLSRDHLTLKEFPQKEIVSGMLAYSETEVNRLVGRVATHEMFPGEVVFAQFLRADSIRPGSQAGLVTPGKVAVTLRVDAVSSHNYMLRPGDFIDIVGYFNAPPGTFPVLVDADASPRAAKPAASTRDKNAAAAPRNAPPVKPYSTLLFAEAVRILAVDNRTVERVGGQNAELRYNTLTIELDPNNAYRLLDAQFQGAQLSFPLRARGEAAHRQDGPVEVNYRDFRQPPPPAPGEGALNQFGPLR